MKYLVQIDLARLEDIKRSLAALRASGEVKPIEQVMDYIVIDVPPELVPSISALGGVIAVTPERWLSIKQVLIPIDEKIAEFQKLFLSNPITGPASAFKFSLEADMGKERIPTSESRKMVGADVADADAITGKGIKVAVLDTGTNILGVQGPYIGGSSTVEGMPIQADENGHGTHVQTTISGRPFQSIHGLLKGVAVDADVAAFKVLGYGIGAGTNTAVLRGMMDAFNWGASIISMSLGSPYTKEPPEVLPECRAIKMLTQQGIICVVANGNCLSGTTRVLTVPRSKQPNRRRGGFKEIRYVSEGDLLINYNPITQCFETDKVVRTYKRQSKKSEKIFRITTDEGHVVETSDDHLFLTDEGWRKAHDLKIGDHLTSYPETPSQCRNPVRHGFQFISKHRHQSLAKLGARLSARVTRKREIRFCNHCNRTFEVQPHSDQRFCSQECVNSWMLSKHFSPQTEFKKGHIYIPVNIDEIAMIGKSTLLRWKREHPKEALEASRMGAIGTRKKQQKPTSIEKRLYELLGGLGIGFEPEYPIQIGGIATIADVAILDRKIAIYADGDYWHSLPYIIEKDKRITQALRKNGWQVFRFTGKEIKEGQVDKILERALVATDPIITDIQEIRHKVLYDLETEKNHTIVANGLIVHNSGPEPNTVGVPANSPDALSIGAVDIDGNIASFSSRGPTAQGLVKPDCCAPGVNILSTSAGLIAAMQFMDGPPLLAAISGTSMSCPHISGAVALALQYARMKGKKLTTEGIKEALELYGEPKNNDYGHGLITYPLLKRYIDR